MSNDELTIPVFPLGGVVLFPHTRQLLHIFEPRYRQLTEDALEGNQSFGMVLPRDSDSDGPPALHRIGCLGSISASRRLPDGRFVILLEGRTRFEVLGEVAGPKLYREVRARLLPEPDFEALDIPSREHLLAARSELEAKLLELSEGVVPDAAETLADRMRQLDPIALTHTLAFSLDCPPIEKQSLLEADTPHERCRRLLELLEFHRIESQLPDSPRTLN